MTNNNENTDMQCLRIWEVSALTRLGKSTVWAKTKTDPSFPKPFKLGPRTTAWLRAEVEAWMTARVSAARMVS